MHHFLSGKHVYNTGISLTCKFILCILVLSMNVVLVMLLGQAGTLLQCLFSHGTCLTHLQQGAAIQNPVAGEGCKRL
jgi:predicted short-subunit dehydrogenase-like oxidoreductase (DUF2520 family)